MPAVRTTGAEAEPATEAKPPPVDDERWRLALEQVLRDRRRLALHTQPVVELTTGQVAGYEALSRFDGAVVASPDQWFAAAERWGVNAQLQAMVLDTAVAMRSVLPPDTFLTANVEPHLLTDPVVAGALLDHADLSRFVLEITEHTQAQDPAALADLIGELRRRGALIAMDDAGTGHAGLSQLLALRPDIVKLDRDLVSGLDADPVKRALVEVLGDLVGRMDGWILAEGIETAAELDAVIALGVPLGQGWALARPEAAMRPALPDDLVARIRTTASRAELREHVVSLVRPASAGPDPTSAVDVLLGSDGRPKAVRCTVFERARWAPALIVAPSASLAEVARRVGTRATADVGVPVVCTDGQGRVMGLVLVADLLTALAASL